MSKAHTIGAIAAYSKIMSGPEFMTWLHKEYEDSDIPAIMDVLDRIGEGDTRINMGQVI